MSPARRHGTTLTFQATVAGTGSTPSGPIYFFHLQSDGSLKILALLNVDAAGKAGLTISNLDVGNHTIFAVYAGDDNFTASLSNVLTQTVQDFPGRTF